ncbi:MAG: hypothetical protein K9M75_06230 [Phycisphaerae bacterium]|nr:hypothetical protein [Phycisphaerae bacterium]
MKLSSILKAFVFVLVLAGVAGSEPAARGDSSAARGEESVFFVPVGVYVDSGDNSLGVYQVEIKALKGDVKIVGVEGGEHAAFKKPPYYDPAALMKGRIILAKFSTQDDLPVGRTRVATLHMQVSGDVLPEYQVIVNVVGDGDGKTIEAAVTVE